MKLPLLLVIVGVILDDIGHFKGQSRGGGSQGWGLDVSASRASRRGSVSEPGARGREGGQFVGWQVMVAQLGSLSRMGWASFWSAGSEEEQLCVTSCLALSKPFFLSEPPGFFLCKWRC